MRSPGPLVALLKAAFALAIDAALLALAFGGLAEMARDPRALALLAIWGAGSVVLALRRPARGQEVEASEPDPLPMLVLLVVPLVTPALGAWAARQGWWTLPYANTLSWFAIALVAGGLALRVAAMLALGPRFSPLVAVQRGHVLETAGPYRRVRHPGYLGALLACLGGALAFGSAAALPLVALMLVAQLARVRREEAVLARTFGAAWDAYAARTGALLPWGSRLRRFSPSP
jgi:protein-S-isoprenylcysteine O-methyltransferase Ste14